MEKTALVICKVKYFDIKLNRHINKNEIIEVSVKRAKEIINSEHKVCELIEIK